jgi:RimJ/RimL family protein N-acetyltransferase
MARVHLASPAGVPPAALAALTARPATMRWVGDGRPWDLAKARRFLEHSAAEEAGPQAGRTSFFWAVYAERARGEQQPAFAGIVGLHPVRYRTGLRRDAPFVTIFLAPAAAGRGVGSAALRVALARYRRARPRVRAVYADVREGNAGARAFFQRFGFHEVEPVTVGRTAAVRFVLRFRARPRRRPKSSE